MTLNKFMGAFSVGVFLATSAYCGIAAADGGISMLYTIMSNTAGSSFVLALYFFGALNWVLPRKKGQLRPDGTYEDEDNKE